MKVKVQSIHMRIFSVLNYILGPLSQENHPACPQGRSILHNGRNLSLIIQHGRDSILNCLNWLSLYCFTFSKKPSPVLGAHGPLGWIATAAEAEDLGFHGLTHRTARVVASYDTHGALRTLRAYSDLISIVCDAIKKQDMMIYRSTINLSWLFSSLIHKPPEWDYKRHFTLFRRR